MGTYKSNYLEFKDFYAGQWHCGGDYPTVFMTHVRHWGGGVGREAYVWVSNVNIDYDGSPTAYGPRGVRSDDALSNAGPGATNGWYGVKAMRPQDADARRREDPQQIRPKVDKRAQMDVFGRFPVIQQVGEPSPGNYVSSTSVPADTSFKEWDQRRWVNSVTYPYGALSGMFRKRGISAKVALNDYGLAIRLDKWGKNCGFSFKDSGGDFSTGVGECSQKVFTELGGIGKDNNFLNVFLVFPWSARQDGDIRAGVQPFLRDFSSADNADELAKLLAFCAQGGPARSGYQIWKNFQEMPGPQQVRVPRPSVSYVNIMDGLREWGFTRYPTMW